MTSQKEFTTYFAEYLFGFLSNFHFALKMLISALKRF